MQDFHPALTHFPIALLLVGFLFDVLSAILKKDSLRVSGWWCLLVGGVSLLAATASGIYAENTAGHNDASHIIMDRHKQLAYISTALFGILVVWRGLRKNRLFQSMSQLAMYYTIGVLAVGTMVYGAHLGGRLVYEYGVGVAAVSQGESGGHEHNHGDGPDHHHTVAPNSGADSTVSEAVPASSQSPHPGETHTHSDGSSHTH